MKRALLLATLVVCACGGKIVGEGGGPVGGGDASSETGSGGGGGGGGGECGNLAIQLGALRSQLQACSPMARGQCQVLVEDVCCTIAVQSSSTAEFTGLVQQYKAKCTPGCPPCVPVAQTCRPTGSDPNSGTCR